VRRGVVSLVPRKLEAVGRGRRNLSAAEDIQGLIRREKGTDM